MSCCRSGTEKRQSRDPRTQPRPRLHTAAVTRQVRSAKMQDSSDACLWLKPSPWAGWYFLRTEVYSVPVCPSFPLLHGKSYTWSQAQGSPYLIQCPPPFLLDFFRLLQVQSCPGSLEDPSQHKVLSHPLFHSLAPHSTLGEFKNGYREWETWVCFIHAKVRMRSQKFQLLRLNLPLYHKISSEGITLQYKVACLRRNI